MKLLFESWRGYLGESSNSDLDGITALLKKHYPEEEWEALEKLGQGMGGKVFLIQDFASGERRALKVVTSNSEFYGFEAKNYAWVAQNRDSLPTCPKDESGKKINDKCVEVQNYLPKVFSVKRAKGVDLIQMEVLEAVPRRVLDDLFKTMYMDTTKRKADILLSNLDFVEKIVRLAIKLSIKEYSVFLQFPHNNPQLLALPDAISTAVMEQWKDFYEKSVQNAFPGKEIPKGLDIIPNWIDRPEGALYNIIRKTYTNQLKQFVNSLQLPPVILTKALGYISRNRGGAISKIEDILRKSPVPLGVDKEANYTWESHTEEVADLFPEARGLNRAMRFLRDEHGFVAQDVHEQNVMTRPDSNDLVVVDLGLFDLEDQGDSEDSWSSGLVSAEKGTVEKMLDSPITIREGNSKRLILKIFSKS